MKNKYKYYINNIKPIEKNFNKFCLLYSIFKWKYFYNKKKFYNTLLISYYKTINKEDIPNNLFNND